MEMALIISVVAAVLAIFTVYRTAREILKNMGSFEEDRRKAFRRFIISASSLAAILILAMVGATAWVASEKESANEALEVTSKNLQDTQAGLNKANQDLATARRRGADEFVRGLQDAIKNADAAATKAAGLDNEENRKKLGDKFDDAQKSANDEALAKLKSITEHVEKWRPVADALRDAMGTGIKMIDDAVQKGDLAGAGKGLAAIKETQQADADKIKAALDAASAPPAPAKPAAPAPAAEPAKADAPKGEAKAAEAPKAEAKK
jgi:hypothetical protein